MDFPLCATFYLNFKGMADPLFYATRIARIMDSHTQLPMFSGHDMKRSLIFPTSTWKLVSYPGTQKAPTVNARKRVERQVPELVIDVAEFPGKTVPYQAIISVLLL